MRGIVAAAVTPRRQSGSEVDLGAMLEIVDFLGTRGVQGIALLGCTGEFLHFSFDERTRLANLAIKRSRVPIMVNVSHSTLDGAVRLGQAAVNSGARALLLMPPYFYRYDQDDIANFYFQFYGEVGHKVPLYLYNVPAFTNPLAFETVQALAATEFFAGIKDSSGDWENLQALAGMVTPQPFTVLVGNDNLAARGLQAGGPGVVSGVACAMPELLVALGRAIEAKDEARAGALDARLHEFIQWLDYFPTPVGVKEAAKLRGMPTGPSATTLAEAGQRRLVQFRSWFTEWYPVVVKECAHG